MNHSCAAGTGSFIEEQAVRLGVKLCDISEMAAGQKSPLVSDRCTVYMERDISCLLAEGWTKNQVMAAVLFSVRDNYLSKVSGKTSWGEKIYFQGATAKCKALVAVFEKAIGRPIAVSKYCHLTGALGAALILREKNNSNSGFIGLDLSYSQNSEICRLCPTQCLLSVYTVNGEKIAWGLRCGRKYKDSKVGNRTLVSKLENKYNSHYALSSTNNTKSLTIGLVDSICMKDYLQLFGNFFLKLGLNVVIENADIGTLESGRRIAGPNFCAPSLFAFGLAKSLLKKKADYVFFRP